MALDINTAGIEFVKTVISLYRSAKYFREKEILAQKFMGHAIEAGRLTEEVSLCPEYKENYYAQSALDELSKATFILKVMCEDGIYPARRVQPVKEYAEQLKALLKLYLNDQPEVVVAAPVEQPPLIGQFASRTQASPEGQAEALPETTVPPQEQNALPAPEDKTQAQKPPVQDKGGFYEIYTGKL